MPAQVGNDNIPAACNRLVGDVKVAAAVLAGAVDDDQRSTTSVSWRGSAVPHEKAGGIIGCDIEFGALHKSVPFLSL